MADGYSDDEFEEEVGGTQGSVRDRLKRMASNQKVVDKPKSGSKSTRSALRELNDAASSLSSGSGKKDSALDALKTAGSKQNLLEAQASKAEEEENALLEAVDTGTGLSKMIAGDYGDDGAGDTPMERAENDQMRPCIYSMTLRGRDSVRNELVEAFLAGKGDEVHRLLKLSNPATFTEPIDKAQRTVAHYAAFHNQHTVLSAQLRLLITAVEQEFVGRLKDIRNAEATRVAEAGIETEDDKIARGKWLAKVEDSVERQYHLALEDAWINVLMHSDSRQRTMLHHAALSCGLSVEALLDTGAGGDFKALGSRRQPLFPPGRRFCPGCGGLVKRAPSSSPARSRRRRPKTPSRSVAAVPSKPPAASLAAKMLFKGRKDDTSLAATFASTGSSHFSAATSGLSVADMAAAALAETAKAVPQCQQCGIASLSVNDIMSVRSDAINARDYQGGTALHYASSAGDVRACKSLLRAGADRHIRDSHGDTPLAVAAHGVVRKVLVPLRSAVKEACAPGVPDPEGGAPPTDAATTSTQEQNEALRTLVACGEDINRRTGAQLRAPLHMAAHDGQLGVVKYLLSVAATIDVADANGWTPLHFAAEDGSMDHLAVAEHLIDQGADKEVPTNGQKTPLHFAAMQNWLPAAKSGAAAQPPASSSPATGGSSPVGVAMIKMLVGKGCDLEARDVEENTPLHWACRKGRAEAAHTLLELGANVYAQNLYGSSPLHLAVMNNHLPVIRLLTRYDSETGRLKLSRDCHNKRPFEYCANSAARQALNSLFEAAGAGKLDKVQQMLRASRELSVQTACPWKPAFVWETTRTLERTALHCVVTGAALACSKAYHECGIEGVTYSALLTKPRGRRDTQIGGIGLGLSDGLIYGADNSKLGRQMLATEKQFGLVARLLIKYGCSVDVQDVDGTTALMLAAKHDLTHLAFLLLSAGASIDLVDNNGNTALHYAYAFNQARICTLLESRDANAELLNKQGNAARDSGGTDGGSGVKQAAEAQLQRSMRVRRA